MRNSWILALIISGCGHAQKFKPCPSTVPCPEQCLSEEQEKVYHLEKFEKLCLTLHYAYPFVMNKEIKRNMAETLRACERIYGSTG